MVRANDELGTRNIGKSDINGRIQSFLLSNVSEIPFMDKSCASAKSKLYSVSLHKAGGLQSVFAS